MNGFAGLRARVTAVKEGLGPLPAGLSDVDAAVALQLARRDKAVADATAAAEAARWAGGPCSLCGFAGRSGRVNDRTGTVTPYWASWEDRPVCAVCYDELAGLSDVERRDRVLRGAGEHERGYRAGLLPWASSRWHAIGYLAERAQFAWFHETPGAVPSPLEHFAYVDRGVLLARVDRREEPAVVLHTGGPCRWCGVTDRFTMTPVFYRERAAFTEAMTTSLLPWEAPAEPEFRQVGERPFCTACQEPGDLDLVVAAIVGLVAPVAQEHRWALSTAGCAARLGLTGWAGSGQPAQERPFGWWGTAAGLRAAALAAYPQQHLWRPNMYERARLAAAQLAEVPVAELPQRRRRFSLVGPPRRS